MLFYLIITNTCIREYDLTLSGEACCGHPGQVKILIFLVKIKFFPMYVNIFCDAGQVPILRYFEAWSSL